MPHATVPSPGLQALILCGPGSSLSTFTSNVKDLPKAIIPIANRPMVWYPLDWCYRMGVTDITLISPPESSPALEAALATNPALTTLPSPRPEILAPAESTQTTGTAELLRLPEVQKCITSDFIILPCDLISELDGTRILQQWMTLNPLSLSGSTPVRGGSAGGDKAKGGLTVFYPTYGLESITTKHDETDFLATVPRSPPAVVPAPAGSLRPHIEQIVLSMPTDTLRDKMEADKGVLRLRQSLLSRHARVKLRTKHRDAHVYVLPYWAKDFAARNEGFESVSEDILGWWGKATWQDGALAEKLQLNDLLRGKADEATNGDMLEGDAEEEIDLLSLSSTKTSSPAAEHMSNPTFASRVGAVAATPRKAVKVPPLLAYVQPATPLPRPLIRRVDTSPQLLSVSLYLAKQPPEHSLAHEHKIHPTAKLEQQSRVSQEDCLIAENVKLGFRSNVKESVIGANCEIGRNVRLTRCLLMEGVVIGDGVQLTGCIVGRRARIDGVKRADAEAELLVAGEAGGKAKKGKGRAVDGADDEEKTKLTDCEVAPGFVIEAGTEAKGEKFMGFDTDDIDGDGMDDDGDEGTAEGFVD